MKLILGVVAAVALFIPGGQAFSVGVFTSLGASAAVAATLATAFGWALVGVVINSVASVITSEKPVASNSATEQRLNKSVIPESPRKIVFGETAAPLDIRYWEAYGTDNNSYDEVIAVATHSIESFGRYWLEDEEHTFSPNSSILGAAFRRYTKTDGSVGSPLTAGAGAKWTATSKMTGCAYFVLKYVYSQEDWPRSFPTRMTQEIKGAKVYDPRLDSTNGGVGTHRTNDQSTWEYNDGATDIGRNPALQMLWYLIGWRINGILVAGMGVDVNSISLQGFVQAANDVEAAGYNCDCVLSTGDNHEANIGIIEASCGGRLLDTGGIYTMHIAVDDTANIAVAFTEDDIVGGFEWVPSKKMRDQVNEITGKYISPDALYQFRPMPPVANASYTASDGYTRRANNVYASVQDSDQAQDLARIELNKTRYQGIFKAPFNYKALQAKNWSIVTLSIAHYGWVDKLFRIIGYGVTTNGIIVLTLQETDSSIYTVEAASPVSLPGIGTAFDPRAKIAVAGLAVAAQAVQGDGDTSQDGLLVSFTEPSSIIDYTEVMYKVSTDTDYILAPSMPTGEISVVIAPLNALTDYDVRARHVTVEGVRGVWNQASATATGNFSAVAWSSIGGTGVPADNADVTDYDINSISLLADPDITITGNTLTKSGGTSAWETTVFNSIEAFKGSVLMSFKVGSSDCRGMYGIDSDPSLSNSYTTFDYCFYLTGADVRVYESGVNKGTVGAFAIGTLLTLTWDGVKVRYYIDNGLEYTSASSPSPETTMYLVGDCYTVGMLIHDITLNQGTTLLGDPWGSSENLLGIDAGPSHVAVYYYHTLKPIVDFDLVIGNPISLRGFVSCTDAAATNVRLIINFYTAADAFISQHNGTLFSGVFTGQISRIDNLIIPATAAKISVYFSRSTGTSALMSAERVMLNRGPVASPFVLPIGAAGLVDEVDTVLITTDAVNSISTAYRAGYDAMSNDGTWYDLFSLVITKDEDSSLLLVESNWTQLDKYIGDTVDWEITVDTVLLGSAMRGVTDGDLATNTTYRNYVSGKAAGTVTVTFRYRGGMFLLLPKLPAKHHLLVQEVKK